MEFGEDVEWSKRWPDFKVEEVLSNDQLFLLDTKGVFPYSFRALDKLQAFRSFCDAPLQVNALGKRRRGSRSLHEIYEINRETRGKERGWDYSFHAWCAFDVSSTSISVPDLYRLAVSFVHGALGAWGGIGLYKTFIHVDDRDVLNGKQTIWKVVT